MDSAASPAIGTVALRAMLECFPAAVAARIASAAVVPAAAAAAAAAAAVGFQPDVGMRCSAAVSSEVSAEFVEELSRSEMQVSAATCCCHV